MELRHLHYFVAVAEMENVSRAALKLHVSQPTLSTQIRDLEDELGFMLFERTGKSVRLTDAGFSFLKEARGVLERTDEAVRNARAFAQAGEQSYTSVMRRHQADTSWQQQCALFKRQCLTFT
jgi:LysR family transcriptional regulator, benzoate and cis,cis-muconate-responsive activator of ben and cat genes